MVASVTGVSRAWPYDADALAGAREAAGTVRRALVKRGRYRCFGIVRTDDRDRKRLKKRF